MSDCSSLTIVIILCTKTTCSRKLNGGQLCKLQRKDKVSILDMGPLTFGTYPMMTSYNTFFFHCMKNNIICTIIIQVSSMLMVKASHKQIKGQVV